MQRLPGFRDEPRRKITVDEFMRMFELGILDEDDRVELIDGELLPMSPQDPPHIGSVVRLHDQLREAYGRRNIVLIQCSWYASKTSLPEPDAAVVRGPIARFDERWATAKDTILLVEVSNASRARDVAKRALYARAGVPVYWRLDVESRLLEVHTRPGRNGYRTCRVVLEGSRVRIPGTKKFVRVADLLPSRKHRPQ